MRAFLARHQYLIIWISGLLIIGALTILVIQLNGVSLPNALSLNQPSPNATPLAPALPPTPSISLTIQKSRSSSTLMLRWQNLPDGTTELLIFRGKANSTSSWKLWKTVVLGQDQFSNGTASFKLNPGDAGYEYFVQASSGGGGVNGNASSTILWESSPTVPTTGGDSGGGNGGTNGSGGGTGGGGNGDNGNGSEGGGNSSTTQGSGGGNSSSSNGGNGSSTGIGTGGGTGGGNSSGTGDPYYNPQIQITGYGTANGSFWVQHVNQSIEIGWQDLPTSTTAITVTRSQDKNGPWNQILSQQNPSPSGSYSLQLVDGTLGDPYYYEMTAFTGTTTIGVYGPAYLPPTGQ